MFVYEVDSNCEEIRTYSYQRSTPQLEHLLSILGQEVDVYIAFCLGLLAVVGALVFTSENKTNPVPYPTVIAASWSIAATISALYLSYFSLRSQIPEIESGRLCIPIFDNLATHIGGLLLAGAVLALVILFIRVRGSFG
jgi:hypothetical protein